MDFVRTCLEVKALAARLHSGKSRGCPASGRSRQRVATRPDPGTMVGHRVHECAVFPTGRNDDIVDALSQALICLVLKPLLEDRMISYEGLDDDFPPHPSYMPRFKPTATVSAATLHQTTARSANRLSDAAESGKF
jgi:hypothetical protein